MFQGIKPRLCLGWGQSSFGNRENALTKCTPVLPIFGFHGSLLQNCLVWQRFCYWHNYIHASITQINFPVYRVYTMVVVISKYDDKMLIFRLLQIPQMDFSSRTREIERSSALILRLDTNRTICTQPNMYNDATHYLPLKV